MTLSRVPPPPFRAVASYGPGPTQPVAAVDHVAQVLTLFRDHPDLRVTDVADRLGIARSTAHRLLKTLAQRGIVAQDRDSRRYRLGPVLIEVALASIDQLDSRRRVRHHLRDISQELGETVSLVGLEGPYCRFIDGEEGTNESHTAIRTGGLLPAYALSGGKVLLAALSEEEVRRLYRPGLRGLTGRTVVDMEDLLDELAAVRANGYALNREESAIGLSAVAVPVVARTGRVVAALVLSAPSRRFANRDVGRIVAALRRTSKSIRADMI